MQAMKERFQQKADVFGQNKDHSYMVRKGKFWIIARRQRDNVFAFTMHGIPATSEF